MSLLTLSTNQITFEGNDTVKTVQLTNVGGSDMNRKPIMYKIKTNKIDYVDAKPSCGYISGLKGQNQIGVLIRSLAAKKEFSAKLQILYVSHEKITEELVEKNKRHFDLIEYNELYDSIKQGNQNDVKSAIIIVNRKPVDSAKDPPVSTHSEEKAKSRLSEGSTLSKESVSSRYDSIPMETKKRSSCGSLVLMLIIGIVIGFLLGAMYGKDLGIDGSNIVSRIARYADVTDIAQDGKVTTDEEEEAFSTSSIVGDKINEISNSGQQGSASQQVIPSQVHNQIPAEQPLNPPTEQQPVNNIQPTVQVKDDQTL